MTDDIGIAIYLRLSMEDDVVQDESNSITNQRILLREYVQEVFSQENLQIEEYTDDGYSGTNFDRPAMIKMLEDVREGKITCIIVKDFSRFSRDYIEMGSYLEQIFPFLGIRFISVNDHYDSNEYQGKLAGLDSSFKYLMNDLYSKDISVKVKSTLDMKRDKGIYANGSTTFGYRKDPKDCHTLLIEEPEAKIIRRIFQMTVDGYSSVAIAKQFNEEKVKTPIEYKMERGVTTMKPKGKGFIWNSSTICQMLRNEMYAGDLVYGKYETPEVGGKAHLKPRKEWKVYTNHHEAIIDRETFEAVQTSRGKRKNKQRRQKHPLIGKLSCSHCGKSLKIEHSLNPYFFCPTRYQTKSPECVYQVNVMYLEQVILYALEQEIRRQVDFEQLQIQYSVILQQKMEQNTKELQLEQEKLRKIQLEKVASYEKYRKKEFSREEYLEIQAQLQGKEQAQETVVARINDKLQKMRQELQACIQNKDTMKQKCGFTELTKDVVDTFISRVKIEDEKHIEIVWNFKEMEVMKQS